MATQQQIDRHDSIIQQLIDRFYDMLEDTTKTLENTVAGRVLGASTPEELVETRLPINADFQTIMSAAIRDFMSEFDRVARDVISWTPGDPTDRDRDVVSQLKQQSYARLDETVKATRENIHTEILMGALAGAAVTDIAQTVRHAISGLMITSNDVEITRLQNQLRRLRAKEAADQLEIDKIVSRLKTRFQGVRVGGSLAHVANREMHDLVMDFDGVFIVHRATQAGLDKFRYSGSLVADSRDFCISNQGRVFTADEAKAHWSSRSWGGKRSGDPFVVRGGYGCRHFWVPVE